MLEAKNIHKSYNAGKKVVEVLKGFDLSIKRGELVAVIGPSGAGKSTLLNILGGLDTPTQGSVFLKGEDLYSLGDRAIGRLRNKNIGFVFQFYHLLGEFTVLENVLMPVLIGNDRGDESAGRKSALELLAMVGLKNRIDHFPSELSGGEQQRVAIVRSLINSPEVLLCDEPTGNLDSESGKEILSLIRRVNKENSMTVVLVTHNLELANSADRVCRLKDGKLVN